MKPKKSAPPSPGNSSREVTREEIAERARQIWQERGQPEGRDEEHWLEAERQLRGQRGPAGSASTSGTGGDPTDAEREADARLDGLVQRPRDS